MNARQNREAQRIAIRFLHQLAAVHELGTVMVRIDAKTNKSNPITLFGKPDSDNREWSQTAPLSFEMFLSFNVPLAKKNGGTWRAFWATRGKNKSSDIARWDDERLEPETLESAISALGIQKALTEE